MNKTTKIFILYLTLLSAILISTFPYNYTFSDEGTHLLLTSFYKDLLTNLPNLGMSYPAIYAFSTNYLVHYPKLQIAYPPLFHITSLIPSFFFGPSVIVNRVVNLVYATMTFFVFYMFVKKYFNDGIAIISSILFSLSSYSLLYASRAFQDFSAYFFIILSAWVFTKAKKEASIRWFAVLSVTSAMAFLGKQVSLIVAVFFIVSALFLWKPDKCKTKKERTMLKAKCLLVYVFFMLAVLSPYLIILKSVGGFEINKIVAVGYASQQGEPTNPLDPAFWLFFAIQPTFYAPFTLILIAMLFLYVYKKEKHWKEFLVYFLILYIGLSAIPNKELRFSQLFLLPAYVSAAFYLKQRKRILSAFIAIYAITSAVMFYPTIQSYPQGQISETIFAQSPPNSSISMFSDEEPLYSSVLISEIAIRDTRKNLSVIRPCAFSGKTREEIVRILDDTNTYFVLYSTWSADKTIDDVKDLLTLNRSFSQGNLKAELYTYNGFAGKVQGKMCNYICLTGEKICEK